MLRLLAALALVSVLWLGASSSLAQQPAKPQPALGINLNGPADWNSELPFVDVFRLSRQWISQEEGKPWGKGPALSLDEHGWIKELQSKCRAETPLCTIAGGHYPSGQYVVLYDGEGELSVNNAQIAENKPGRMLLNVDASRGGFFLVLRKTNPQNYIRNIRVIMPGFEQTYQKEPFHPILLQRWQGMKCIRFMDWMHTNGSKIKTWSERPKLTDFSWTRKGVPVEVMVDLCNRLQADAWFCMPEEATDEYVSNFARQVKTSLDPSLKVYIEYSNEVWNGMFAANRYAARKAKELGIGLNERPWEQACLYYGRRSLEIFDLWEKEFGGTDRLVRTLAWQAASGKYWLDGQLLSKVDAKKVDALAIAPYISLNAGPQSKPSANEVASWTIDRLMDHVESKSLPQSIQHINDAAAIARKYNVKLLCYEAGQHLVGVSGGDSNDALTRLYHEANRHARMGEIYTKYYKAWEEAGGDLLCHFSSIGNWTKWGSWGLAEYYNQGPADVPKYAATINWAKSLGQNVNPNWKPEQ
jgi:hypothetical protein